MSRVVLRLLLAPADGLVLQVPRALVVSIVAMAIDVGLLFLLVSVSVPAIPAAIVSYLTGGVFQYVLCSLWVFSTGPRRAAAGFLAFTVLSLGGLGITAGTIQLLHEGWRLSLPVAKFVALALAFNWNFFTRKFLLFRSESPSESLAQ